MAHREPGIGQVGAGIVNAPYYYDPHFYLEHARTRRNEVLNLMRTHGYINEAEWKLAKTVNVEDLLVDPSLSNKNTEGYAYQAYIDEALKEAEPAQTGLLPVRTGSFRNVCGSLMEVLMAVSVFAGQVCN